MLEKTCCKCKTSKSTSEFYKHKSRYDGLQTRCRECQKYKNISDKEKQQRIKAVVKYRQTETGKQQHRDTNKRYYNTDKGKINYQNTQQRYLSTEKGQENRRKRHLKYQLKKYYADPEYYKLKNRAYHAGVPLDVLKQVKERDKVCQLCKSDKDLQFDHIHPTSLGGKGSLKNLQLLCGPCNNFKSNNLFLPDGGMILINNKIGGSL